MATRLFSIEQIAHLLGATPQDIKVWMRRGWMPHLRFPDGMIRISEKGLLRFLRDRGVDIGEIARKIQSPASGAPAKPTDTRRLPQGPTSPADEPPTRSAAPTPPRHAPPAAARATVQAAGSPSSAGETASATADAPADDLPEEQPGEPSRSDATGTSAGGEGPGQSVPDSDFPAGADEDASPGLTVPGHYEPQTPAEQVAVAAEPAEATVTPEPPEPPAAEPALAGPPAEPEEATGDSKPPAGVVGQPPQPEQAQEPAAETVQDEADQEPQGGPTEPEATVEYAETMLEPEMAVEDMPETTTPEQDEAAGAEADIAGETPAATETQTGSVHAKPPYQLLPPLSEATLDTAGQDESEPASDAAAAEPDGEYEQFERAQPTGPGEQPHAAPAEQETAGQQAEPVASAKPETEPAEADGAAGPFEPMAAEELDEPEHEEAGAEDDEFAMGRPEEDYQPAHEEAGAEDVEFETDQLAEPIEPVHEEAGADDDEFEPSGEGGAAEEDDVAPSEAEIPAVTGPMAELEHAAAADTDSGEGLFTTADPRDGSQKGPPAKASSGGGRLASAAPGPPDAIAETATGHMGKTPVLQEAASRSGTGDDASGGSRAEAAPAAPGPTEAADPGQGDPAPAEAMAETAMGHMGETPMLQEAASRSGTGDDGEHGAKDESVEPHIPPELRRPEPESAGEAEESQEVTEALGPRPTESVRGRARQIADAILDRAVAAGATDVLLQPTRGGLCLKLRIGGRLQERESFRQRLPAELRPAVVERFRTWAGAESGSEGAVSGALERPVAGRLMRLDVSSWPTVHGLAVSVALTAAVEAERGLAGLALAEDDRMRLAELLAQPTGLVVVAGAVQEHVRRILRSLLAETVGPQRHVAAIERTIPSELEGVLHTQVGAQTHMTYARAAELVAAQHPHAVGVDEFRDPDTVRTLLAAAEECAVVVAGLRAPTAPAAAAALLELGAEAWPLAATLGACVATAQVRVLCDHCKQPGEIDPEALKQLGLYADEVDFFPQTPVGCEECFQTGYLGQRDLFSVLYIQGPVAAALRQGADLPALQIAARELGMGTLIDAGLAAAREGQTSLAELAHVLHPTVVPRTFIPSQRAKAAARKPRPKVPPSLRTLLGAQRLTPSESTAWLDLLGPRHRRKP